MAWYTAPAANATQWLANANQAVGSNQAAARQRSVSSAIRDPNVTYQGGASNIFSDGANSNFAPAQRTQPTLRNDGGQQTQQLPQDGGSGNFSQAPGGAGAANDDALELAQLDGQEQLLRQFLGSSQGKLDQGLQGIEDDFGVLTGKAAGQNARAQQDFNTKQSDTTASKESALGRVDTDARTLANSLRQRIGRASGSGSSAYQITAPGAVAREASIDRDNVQDTFGTNFRDIALGRKRTDEDYNELLGDYGRQKNQKVSGLREGVMDQQNQASGSLGDIARQRQAIQGGGAGAIQAAGAPFQAEIGRRSQAIDSLFGQYRSPYQSRDVQVAAPNLRDYVTNGAQVTQGQQQQQGAAAPTSPYARFMQQGEDEENQLY